MFHAYAEDHFAEKPANSLFMWLQFNGRDLREAVSRISSTQSL